MVQLVVRLAAPIANLRGRHVRSTTSRILLRNHIVAVRGLRRLVVNLARRLLLVQFVLEMLAEC